MVVIIAIVFLFYYVSAESSRYNDSAHEDSTKAGLYYEEAATAAEATQAYMTHEDSINAGLIYQIFRSPEARDIANVFYNSTYTLFDFYTDEPIFPNSDGVYTIYTATNENKTPRLRRGNPAEIKEACYKFKNYSNCKNWCEGRQFGMKP